MRAQSIRIREERYPPCVKLAMKLCPVRECDSARARLQQYMHCIFRGSASLHAPCRQTSIVVTRGRKPPPATSPAVTCSHACALFRPFSLASGGAPASSRHGESLLSEIWRPSAGCHYIADITSQRCERLTAAQHVSIVLNQLFGCFAANLSSTITGSPVTSRTSGTEAAKKPTCHQQQLQRFWDLSQSPWRKSLWNIATIAAHSTLAATVFTAPGQGLAAAQCVTVIWTLADI